MVGGSPLQLPATARPQAGLLRTRLDRSAPAPRSDRECQERRFFREVSAYSDSPERASGAVCRDSRRLKCGCSKVATGQLPWCLRKSFDLPALGSIARAKCHLFNLIVQPRPDEPAMPLYLFTCVCRSFGLPLSPLLPPPSRFSCSARCGHLGLGNLDTVLRSPCHHGSRSDNRLESVANAHTAADLHVRPVSRTALVRDRGRRERI
jgi:hypothetical protein